MLVITQKKKSCHFFTTSIRTRHTQATDQITLITRIFAIREILEFLLSPSTRSCFRRDHIWQKKLDRIFLDVSCNEIAPSNMLDDLKSSTFLRYSYLSACISFCPLTMFVPFHRGQRSIESLADACVINIDKIPADVSACTLQTSSPDCIGNRLRASLTVLICCK